MDQLYGCMYKQIIFCIILPDQTYIGGMTDNICNKLFTYLHVFEEKQTLIYGGII